MSVEQESPQLTDADGRAELKRAVEKMTHAHRDAPFNPNRLEEQRELLQGMFSADDIAGLFIAAIKEPAGMTLPEPQGESPEPPDAPKMSDPSEMIEASNGIEWWADCFPQWKGK